MNHTLQIQLVPPSDAMEAYMERYRAWVEETIGCPLSSALTLELQYPFSHVVLEDLLGDVPLDRQCMSAAPVLRKLVDRWAVPPGVSPRIELNPSRDRSRGITSAQPAWDPHWKNTPIALWLRGLEHPVVFADIPYVRYTFGSASLGWRQWMVVRRDESAGCLARLPDLRNLHPRQIAVIGGQPVSLPEARYDWDTVVLEPSLNDLIRADYETFWESEDWFRKRHLPFRRGLPALWAAGQRKKHGRTHHGVPSTGDCLQYRFRRRAPPQLFPDGIVPDRGGQRPGRHHL